MAYLLYGERPLVAASASARPWSAFRRWVAAAQAARARRHALATLLELDGAQLDDLGISRSDVLEAILNRQQAPGLALSAARARNSRR